MSNEIYYIDTELVKNEIEEEVKKISKDEILTDFFYLIYKYTFNIAH